MDSLSWIKYELSKILSTYHGTWHTFDLTCSKTCLSSLAGSQTLVFSDSFQLNGGPGHRTETVMYQLLALGPLIQFMSMNKVSTQHFAHSFFLLVCITFLAASFVGWVYWICWAKQVHPQLTPLDWRFTERAGTGQTDYPTWDHLPKGYWCWQVLHQEKNKKDDLILRDCFEHQESHHSKPSEETSWPLLIYIC